MAGEHFAPAGPARLRRRRAIRALLVLAALAIVAVAFIPEHGPPRSPASVRARPVGSVSGPAPPRAAPTGGRGPPPATSVPRPTTVPTTPTGALCPCPNLLAGSDPAVLPGPVLIADHLNNRLLIVDPNGTIVWTFPRPGDLAPGQTFLVPDDAFVTPDGRYIVATQEDDFVVSLISIAGHRIVWHYGVAGQPGSGPDHLWNPDDAMMMPDGNLVLADIKNCRVLLLRPGIQVPLHVYGTPGGGCWHDPPLDWGSPNGAFPMLDGDYLVTEINGDWVNQLSPGGTVGFSVHPPAVNYPSDTNEVRPGLYLTVDYSTPGQIVEFDQAGDTVWRDTTGLDHPSLALPLPGGDILCNDDYDHRVIVVDPRTDRVVWQYGHTGVQGSAPGYLYEPDGVDLMPPYSLTIARSATMGEYPAPAGAVPVPGQAGN